MAFSHVAIEEHRNRQLAYLFGMLILIYLAANAAIVAVTWASMRFTGGPPVAIFLYGSVASLTIAVVHWHFSVQGMVPRTMRSLLAFAPDRQDTYHTRFVNVVEEAGVATGGRYRITPYVINSPAMNAMAVSDFDRNAAIAVTEGLLARLNRSQLEAVIGHEAAHIARGDSLVKSVSCSLFVFHEEALKGIGGLFSEGRSRYTVRGRASGYLFLLYLVLEFVHLARQACEMVISRTQEYRADAVSVALTRNPIALAEALLILSKRWRGTGATGESYASLYFVDTGDTARFSEQDNLQGDLLSTHPPIESRVSAVLGMAGVPPERLGDMLDTKKPPKRMVPAEFAPVGNDEAEIKRWLYWTGDAWAGPLDLDGLMATGKINSETWIRPEGDERAVPAHYEPRILARLGSEAAPAPGEGFICPYCRVALREVRYEGTPIHSCPHCGGCYAEHEQVQRVLTREEYDFPEAVRRRAKAILAIENTQRIRERYEEENRRRKDKPFTCPKCRSAMRYRFYTEGYLVEVLKCWMCGMTWFDREELEVLQCLFEAKRGR